MPTIYLRSTDGNDADNGTTWALAKAKIVGAAAIESAGDVIAVSQSHSETTAGVVNPTLADNVSIICCDDAAEPPTTLSTGAVIAATGSFSLAFTTSGRLRLYGLTLDAGFGGSSGNVAIATTANGHVFAEQCVLKLTSNGASSTVQCGSSSGSYAEFVDCSIDTGSNNRTSAFLVNGGLMSWRGGSITVGGTVTSLVALPTQRSGKAIINGFNLSGMPAATNIFAGGTSGVIGIVRNCRLPASWSGALYSGTPAFGARYELHNCDNADTNYVLIVVDGYGSIINEGTIIRSGGASNGTAGISWKMVANSSPVYPQTLDSPEIVQWNETTGSAITATVEIVTDNITLTNEECWLDVQYLGTSGYPLGSFIDDAKADFFAIAANQTSSSETWTTTGLTTPVKQKLSVTFTPQEKGFIHAVVKLAKASATVYVDPLLTIA